MHKQQPGTRLIPTDSHRLSFRCTLMQSDPMEEVFAAMRSSVHGTAARKREGNASIRSETEEGTIRKTSRGIPCTARNADADSGLISL
jgi:hypothetical protein